MPRLPSKADLGQASSLRPTGPFAGGARVNTGAGITALGAGLADLGAAFDKEDKFEAERKFTEFAYETERQYSESLKSAQPGAQGLRDGIIGGYQDSAKKFLKGIPNHLKPAFDGKLLDLETKLSRNSDAFETKERERFATENVVDAHNKLALLVEADPSNYEKAVQSSRVLLDNAPVDNITRETLKKKYGDVVAKSVIEGILKNGGGEKDVRDFLSKMGPQKGASFDPGTTQGKIASNTSNPALALAIAERESSFKHDAKASKTIRGLFQMDGPTRAKYGLGESASAEEQAAAFDKEIAARGDELAKAIGRKPTQAELYFAWHFGAAGAGELLKSDPDRTTKDWVFKTFDNNARAVWDQNKHIRDAGTVGELINRTGADIGKRIAKYGGDAGKEYESGAAPGGELSDIGAFAETRIIHYRDAMERRERARIADEERAVRLEEKRRKDESDSEEVKIAQMLADPAQRASITAMSIANNPRLSRDAIQRNMRLIESADRTDTTYGAKFYELFQRVHLPQGDTNRITSLEQVVPFVREGGGLTLSGYNQIASQMQGKNSPEGEAASKMLSQFLQVVNQELSGTNPLLGIKDPKGEELVLRFSAQALPLYYKKRKEGMTPSQLLDPDSPDYLGKSIKTLKRSTNEMVRDMIGGMGTGEADISTPQGLISAVQSNRITREEGERIAIEKGWIRAPAPAVSPPMSR